jgi:hypothetical protein
MRSVSREQLSDDGDVRVLLRRRARAVAPPG